MTTRRIFSLALALVLIAMLAYPAQAAIITTPFSEFGDGAVVIEYDRNDGNGNVLRFRVINNSDQPAWLGVYDCPGGSCTLLGETVVAGGVTFEQNVPGVTVQWVCELYDPAHPEWGEDCGLQMADYVFQARWPAE